jgi:methyl-accepting chemotaxis protein
MRSWFVNLRTSVKLMLAFGAAVLIAVIVGITGLASLDRLYQQASRVNDVTRGALLSLARFRPAAEASLKNLFQKRGAGPEKDRDSQFYTETEREAYRDQVKPLVELARNVLGKEDPILQAAREAAGSGVGDEAVQAEATKRVGTVSASLASLRQHVAKAEAVFPPAPDAPPATEPAAVTYGDAQEALAGIVREAIGLEGDLAVLADRAVAGMENTKSWGTRLMLLGAGVGILLAFLVGSITTRLVVNPLAEMTAAAHRMSEGDLSAEISHASRDEVGGLADSFRRMQGSLRDLSAEAQRVAGGDLTRAVRGGGQLGESFNRMVESLSALLREIQEAGTQVGDNSNKILGGLQRNAEASREEASAADRVQGSMERLSESARGIAQSATDVERTAGDAARVASHGTAQVGAALEGLFRTRERVNEITQKTLVLGEKCRRIGEVLKIIRDVAGEIHMLALNAAIESAASAGEHGKRFTVVAGEVRRLAERTRQSAEEIRAILTEIQQAAEATVAAAQEGAKEVEAGSTVATGARAALEEVITRIHQTAEVAREISRATQDQRQASEQVAGSMRDISRAVRRMAEGSEESTKAVRELTALAERFGDLMGTFRTG